MGKSRIRPEKLADYQATGYWKGMTMAMCRGYEEDSRWPGLTLHEFFDDTVARFADNDFIIHGETRYTYKQVADITTRLGAGLVSLGYKKNDVICVLLHNCPEMVFLQIALSRIGAIIQPIHLVYREHEIKKRIAFCEAKAIVIPDQIKAFNYVDMMRGMAGQAHVDHVFVVGENKAHGGNIRCLQDVWETADAGALKAYLEDTEVDANDILLLNFTSGTETAPKGFIHTHNTILGNTLTAASDICQFIPGQEVMLSFSPMTHTFGHMISYFACMTGGATVLVDTYDPEKGLALIHKEKISFVQGTPAHFLRFLDHPDFAHYDLGSLKILATGGSAIPPATVKRLEEKTSARLTVWFGMGEDIIHTAVYPGEAEEVFLQTVGQPVPGAELAIIGENGEHLPAGEVGEIGFRGAAMFLGYYKNREKTESTRTNDGWLLTGDTGYVDGDGYLRLYGRKKDMINRGGSKIFPLTIENALSFHPKISSVSVVGIPDPELGERVCACVILKPGESLTQEEIKVYIREKGLSHYETPERIKIMNDFPMTPTGKIKKDLLQKQVVEDGI
ncbi:MAG: acyl--CoA ligase [Desulfatitalea sp.]|nr:acyl--CoA ligase [Desulfatitalea sp.]NNK02176.1 acyl--CoA ligase [Desulfatitalea sp.]